METLQRRSENKKCGLEISTFIGKYHTSIGIADARFTHIVYNRQIDSAAYALSLHTAISKKDKYPINL